MISQTGTVTYYLAKFLPRNVAIEEMNELICHVQVLSMTG